MGFFDKMFKSERDIAKREIINVPWEELTSVDTLDEIEQISKEKPVVILKHSTSCGISRMVLRQFEQEYDLKEGQAKLYFLDLLSHREISNKIASKFNVPHESPQLIVIKNGKVVYDASHSEVKA
ncbi:bacillithiol system redox-active protein YtxJ [Antarcticibacterium sp. 1MA-6-2]|uniref:bacillithiol system redox-active protein YtxJ n=1 Tax=Antarcticibacterium sp. 1MA-6-2 TaxID=2908210 RepID=UPI001F167949|nr:bacillithiol system redox-active protein YtxJ [Antarcticibacterium sp. 1MA-6-2]UJH92264.1 bacillithiol system redox-active protein YtxJ [Antarcticibacterium sp. 1MA-6-2]